MNTNNKKVTLVIVGILVLVIAIGIAIMSKSKNVQPVDQTNTPTQEEVVNTEDNTVSQNPTAPTSQVKKPTITTLSYTYSGYGCLVPPAVGSAPCVDTPPAKVVVNGSFKANGAYVVSWFEYWTVDSEPPASSVTSISIRKPPPPPAVVKPYLNERMTVWFLLGPPSSLGLELLPTVMVLPSPFDKVILTNGAMTASSIKVLMIPHVFFCTQPSSAIGLLNRWTPAA
jgi:hypothetical protein